MESPPTPEALADDLLFDGFEDDPAQAQHPPTDDAKRLARIFDFQVDALANPNPLQACLGSFTGDLLAIGWHIQKRINGALAASSGTIEDITSITPALDIVLRIGRQADRYAQLEAKLTATERQAAAAKQKLQATALGGFVQDVTRRKSGLIPTRWDG